MFQQFLYLIQVPIFWALILTSLVQWLFWRISKPWTALPIASLMFLPAWSLFTLSWEHQSGETPALERWELAKLVTGSHAWGLGRSLTITSLLWFFLWSVVSLFPGEGFRWDKAQLIRVGKVYSALIALLWGACVLLSRYESLQDAVESNDEELAARRLVFNLEGLGPDDGRIREIGGGRSYRASLLPLAVERNNRAMVKLLVEHGADLNPVAANDLIGPNLPPVAHNLLSSTIKELNVETLVLMLEQNVVERNSVALAIKNKNREMLEYLMDLGANPTQGLFSAVLLDEPDLFRFLVQHGADVAVAREEVTAIGQDEVLDAMIERVEKLIQPLGTAIPTRP